jgi:hypothetical protein
LRDLYNEAAETYTSSVNDVNLSRGKTTKEDYDRLRDIGDRARTARDAAHSALDEHKRQHGC